VIAVVDAGALCGAADRRALDGAAVGY
jgi:hypothetical protein